MKGHEFPPDVRPSWTDFDQRPCRNGHARSEDNTWVYFHRELTRGREAWARKCCECRRNKGSNKRVPRKQCPRGHPYNEEHGSWVQMHGRKKPSWRCRSCELDAARARALEANPGKRTRVQGYCINGHSRDEFPLVVRGKGEAPTCGECVRINRLKAGKQPKAEQLVAMREKALRRTRCKRGHTRLSPATLRSGTVDGIARNCLECDRLRSAAKSYLRIQITGGFEVSHLIESAKSNGFDMASFADRFRARLETLEEENTWQLARLRHRTASHLAKQKLHPGLPSAWPWPMPESRPAQTSRR